MEATTIPQVQKQRFKNESGGFIGVVKISVKGEEIGHAVEPGGSVELTYDEMVATANAPRDPKDNPFLPQSYKRVRESDNEIEDYTVTPLVPVSEFRYVPVGDRPVPGFDAAGQPTAPAEAPTGQEAVVPPPSEPDPAPPTAAQMQPPQPPTRAAAAAAEAAAAAAQAPPAPDPVPEAPEEPSVTAETAAEAPAPAEETGAAALPAGPPAGGEFAAHEEVGTPETQTVVQGQAPAGQPAPWSPGSESPEDAAAAGRTPAPEPSGE